MVTDRELFDEENSYMQNQDKWENFGTQNGIEDDGYDHHSLHGAPRFEVTEKINAEFKRNRSRRVDGVLGTDFLERHHAIIDYSRLTLYLKTD